MKTEKAAPKSKILHRGYQPKVSYSPHLTSPHHLHQIRVVQCIGHRTLVVEKDKLPDDGQADPDEFEATWLKSIGIIRSPM